MTGISDADIRHFIYTIFAATAQPPPAAAAAAHFQIGGAAAAAAYRRLAAAHQIVLAPGTDSIWMAHPYSALPTNYVTEVDDRRYWGNCAWDMLGIAAVLGRDGVGSAPCGCGACAARLAVALPLGRPVASDWIVHFVVPAAHFWDDIGHT